jgi:hypothetical protein
LLPDAVKAEFEKHISMRKSAIQQQQMQEMQMQMQMQGTMMEPGATPAPEQEGQPPVDPTQQG